MGRLNMKNTSSYTKNCSNDLIGHTSDCADSRSVDRSNSSVGAGNGLNDRYIVLGVAFGWGARKGLDVFIRLAEDLGDRFQIVLVGTDTHIDAQLPANIISIHRTQDQHELAEIYSAADVFVNPTREENFPTVNMEALACGTPVITFKTGGSPEIIDETCGMVVPCDDIQALEDAIRYVVKEKPFSTESCRKRAEQFDMRDKFAEYVNLYRKICGKSKQ